jgi:hypothetical protein
MFFNHACRSINLDINELAKKIAQREILVKPALAQEGGR